MHGVPLSVLLMESVKLLRHAWCSLSVLLMESAKLLRHVWCSFIRVANGVCEVVAKTCLVFLCPCC